MVKVRLSITVAPLFTVQFALTIKGKSSSSASLYYAKVETWEALDLNQTPPIPLWRNLNLRLERPGKSLRPHTKGLANSSVSKP